MTQTFDRRIDGTNDAETLTGDATSDEIYGYDGDDRLDGWAWGYDRLDGGTGADTMVGGVEGVTFVVDNIGDVVISHPEGAIDTIESSISFDLNAVQYVENLTLTGDESLSGTGNDLHNYLTGNGADNTLTGLDGNDTLDGGAGNDILVGGMGDDIYVVDSAGDTITENADEGIDTVRSSASYGLTGALENLTLTGDGKLAGIGNSLNNYITGNVADNTLNGREGNDTLVGGKGDDTYVIDSLGDTIIESADEGIDSVESAISYALSDALENLTLTGRFALTGTGNGLGNKIYGNGGHNLLSGLGGNDWIEGRDGRDTLDGGDGIDVLLGGDRSDVLFGGKDGDLLDGGSGEDTMTGGEGDDTYYVDTAKDQVIETNSTDIDTVYSTINYTLGNLIENLDLSEGMALKGTGNNLDNVIYGNSLNNTLTGLEGADTLGGGDGTDLLYGGSGDDMFDGGEGSDVLYGGSGADGLYGGAGADKMVGGEGDDVYNVDNQGDLVTEKTGEGSDWVDAFISYTLSANIETLQLKGTDAIIGTGNSIANSISGTEFDNELYGLGGDDTLRGYDGNNVLYGGTGNDWLIGGYDDDKAYGGTGNDQFYGGEGQDTMSGDDGQDMICGGAGLDTLYGGKGDDALYGHYTNHFEDTDANQLYGGAGNDSLVGADGSDTLDGGVGNDEMTGEAGADTFVFDLKGGVDHILDFTSGEDHINIASALSKVLSGASALTADAFYAADGAVSGHDSDDRLIYDTSTGALYYDVDGSGKKAAVQIAVLDHDGAAAMLTFDDFTFG